MGRRPIVIASGNRGKIEEIEKILGREVIPYRELIGEVEIEEKGESFKENALLKGETIYRLLKERGEEWIVLADDSGLVVPALGGRPGIYSARYSGPGATDHSNRQKLIEELKKRGLERTPAHYVAAIGVVSQFGSWSAHGFMYGEVIPEERGEMGFGYDFLFIPTGYSRTLGELPPEVKNRISHRRHGLENIKPILRVLEKWSGK
ncbi:MAG: RdgB/HAM1 family non-canonical purine NTP pyrophosphatase [Campylobacterales bacterium]